MFLHAYKKNLPGKIVNSHYPQYSLGVLISRIFGTVWVHDIDVPTTDLSLKKYTQHHLTTHKTFISYDMYDFEKNVTFRTPA